MHRVVVHSTVTHGLAAAGGLILVMLCSMLASRVACVAGRQRLRGRAAPEDAAMRGRALVQLHLEGQARQPHGLAVGVASGEGLYGVPVAGLTMMMGTSACAFLCMPVAFL